ncbi:YafY family protein [Microlunatus sp. Gsoil 973]|uniref:helix-turn-helix transcriptional regulator n=1 Tax=Microlunatus sp. Gsoil 973 TaxID=2672569 RepID=UPI0012B4BD8B|nr:WYL domain-containing protein [Microlunatus sp. Gsoil 973]QGN31487.1 WYL domain-containing protein [Microlunatus sp. Gsoil 973]
MRSQRLLSMLLLLQLRQRMTARQLADELGVSERTVLRDVLTLAEADIPVFSEQGRHGGIVLLPGSHLDVNRLTPSEVEALRLIGLDRHQAAQLGIDQTTTQRKLRTRPTPTGQTIPLSELVMIDNRGWFEDEPGGADPASLAADLQFGRRLRIGYRRSSQASPRSLTVDPYGLLSRAGRWYLVADHRGHPRLFALERLARWTVGDQPRRLRAGVDLGSVACRLMEDLERSGSVMITALLDADRVDLARRVLGSRLRSTTRIDDHQARITIAYEQLEAVRQLLQFADHLVIIDPPEAAERLKELALATAGRYR